MSYWWVNHKQTYTSEVEGGYIWSPKENSNGARNQTYINLTLTTPGDIVFSYAAGKIKAIGIVESNCYEELKPREFGDAGNLWSNIGWRVPIVWEILSSPVNPKDHINKIVPMLPLKNSPLQASGNGNQGCYLASIQDELGLFLIGLVQSKTIDATIFPLGVIKESVLEDKSIELSKEAATETMWDEVDRGLQEPLSIDDTTQEKTEPIQVDIAKKIQEAQTTGDENPINTDLISMELSEMTGSFVDVYIVDGSDVLGLASDRRLYKLPHEGLGIEYSNGILQVYRSNNGHLVADLSQEYWEESDCKETHAEQSNSFKTINPYLESIIESYILEKHEESISNHASSQKAPSTFKALPVSSRPLYHDQSARDVFDRSILSFNMTSRTNKTLLKRHIHTIRDLVELGHMAIPNLPEESVREVIELTSGLGLFFEDMTSDDLKNYLEIKPSSTSYSDGFTDEVLDRSVESFEMTTRSTNVLMANKIYTIRHLVQLTMRELFKLPNLGKGSVKEISAFTKSLGLFQGMTINDIAHSGSPLNFNSNSIFLENIECLHLSVRGTNCLKTAGINNIGDLVSASKLDLIKLSNLGQKTVNELANKLDSIGLSFSMNNHMLRAYESKNTSFGSPGQNITDILFPQRQTMEDWILELLPKDRTNLLKRVTAQVTLEEMGTEMGVTRERVRQLQFRYERKFRQNWEEHLAEVNLLDLDSSEPTHLFMLSLHSKYFENIHKYIPNTNSFFAQLFSDSDSKYQIEVIEGDLLIVLTVSPLIAEVVSTIKQLNLDNDYFTYLSAVGRLDLRDYIPKYLIEKTPMSNRGKIKKYLRIIFDQSTKLLSAPELKGLLLDKHGVTSASNEISNALSEFGDIFLFGPHGWGTQDKFFVLNNNEVIKVQKSITDIFNGSNGMDIHRDQILKKIQLGNNAPINRKINKYQLSCVLKNMVLTNPDLKARGRDMWGYGLKGKRKTIIGTAIDILHEHGSPLANAELKSLVSRQRSMSGGHFQLHPNMQNPDLVLVDGNKWGLRNRDLKRISKEMESLLIDAILNHFRSGAPVIDSKEFNKIICQLGLDKAGSFFEISRLLLCYTSGGNKTSKDFFRVIFSSTNNLSILVVEPGFKGPLPSI